MITGRENEVNRGSRDRRNFSTVRADGDGPAETGESVGRMAGAESSQARGGGV